MDPVRPAGPGIGQDGIERMVVIEPLEEEIPEGDQGGKKPLIEGEFLEGGQLEQGLAGQALEEKLQQLGRAERGWGVSSFWFRGVFLDGI